MACLSCLNVLADPSAKYQGLRDAVEKINVASRVKDIVNKAITESYCQRSIEELVSMGVKREDAEKEVGKRFLSYGICSALAFQYLLEGKMQPNDQVHFVQKTFTLTVLKWALKNLSTVQHFNLESPGGKECVLEYVNFLENSVDEAVRPKVVKINGQERGHTVPPAINISDLKDNAQIFAADIPDNFLILSPKSDHSMYEEHVIYYNPVTRIIADGCDGRIIQIPDDMEPLKFLEQYLKYSYATYGSLTALSISKSTQQVVPYPAYTFCQNAFLNIGLYSLATVNETCAFVSKARSIKFADVVATGTSLLASANMCLYSGRALLSIKMHELFGQPEETTAMANAFRGMLLVTEQNAADKP